MVLDGKLFSRNVFLVMSLLFITLTVPGHCDMFVGASSSGPHPSAETEEPVQENSKEYSRSTLVDTNTGEISVGLTVPNTSWGIRIQSVYKMEEKLWIFSEVSSRGVGASVISTVRDTVMAEDPPDSPVKHFVSGKDWNWENTEDVTFIGYLDYYQLKMSAWWSGEQIEFHRSNSN